MPSYKLTYFEVKARAEPSRYMFALAGVEYEDVRVKSEEFQKLKASGIVPLGQLPILQVDGQVINQSFAIHKYVAEVTGLMPTDSMESAKVWVIVETCKDVSTKLMEVKFQKDEAKKEELKKTLHDNFMPKHVAFFESKLAEGGGDWFVGNKVSLADVMVFNVFVDVMELGLNIPDGGVFGNAPKLRGLINQFANIPGIKAWIEKRPKTNF